MFSAGEVASHATRKNERADLDAVDEDEAALGAHSERAEDGNLHFHPGDCRDGDGPPSLRAPTRSSPTSRALALLAGCVHCSLSAGTGGATHAGALPTFPQGISSSRHQQAAAAWALGGQVCCGWASQ